MTRAIITSFLINTRDPMETAKKVGLEANGQRNALAHATFEKLGEYMQPWAMSVKRIGCERIVLHDGLPEAFMRRYHWLRFEHVEHDSDEIAWVRRYRLLRKYLDRRPEIERLFFTDINDLGVFVDPFEWHDSLGVSPDFPVLGEEWDPIGKNHWFTGQYERFPDDLRAFFENVLPEAVAVSAGVWGGYRGPVIKILAAMLESLDRNAEHFAKHPHVSWDMMTFNHAVFSGAAGSKFIAFKMEMLAHPHRLSGAVIRGVDNPFLHDKSKTLARIAAHADRPIGMHVLDLIADHPERERILQIMDEPRCQEEHAPYSPLDRTVGLAELVATMFPQSGTIVETGRYWGVSTETIARLRPEATIHSVDNYPHEKGLQRLADVPNVKLITADSIGYLQTLPDRSIDALYKDDNHGFDHMRQALEVAKRKVREGGVIAGHDYQPDELGVIRATNEVFGAPPHRVFSDSSWAYVV